MSISSSHLGKLKKLGLVAAASALVTSLALPPAAAYDGGPWFVADKPYVAKTQWVAGHDLTIGDLADPDVFQENGIYYAYGTTVGGRNVPLITSTDLKNWKTNKRYSAPSTSPDGRPVLNAKDWWFNDTLALPGRWAQRQPKCTNTHENGCYEIWAPSVEKMGDKYLMAYVAVSKYGGGYRHPKGQVDHRRCIGLATSSSPTGPFFDTSSQPLICDPVSTDPNGSLDPDLFKDPKTGKVYLYWKNEGKPTTDASSPTRFHVRELRSDLTLAPAGAHQDSLLTTQQVIRQGKTNAETWQGTLIENPSMVYWPKTGKYYMFFSGNHYKTLGYGEGYAECDSPTGPCRVASQTPLLRTNADWGIGGPGGGSAFIDKSGQMRLAYAAWRADRADYDCDEHVGHDCTDPAVYKCNRYEVFFENQEGCTSNQRFLHIGTVQSYTEGSVSLLALPKKSEFAWAAAQTNPQPRTFTDIVGKPFSTHINWLAASEITTGNKDGTFAPEQDVSRAAMAAFLYRLAGSPAYTAPARSPFKDVPTDHQFYKEISWLASSGITTGWPDGTFRPQDGVSRAAMAAFFYRLAGSPAYTSAGVSPFTDAPTGHPFYKEISWLASSGVTTGWPDGTFRPKNNVNRATMAAFMFRLSAKQWPLMASGF